MTHPTFIETFDNPIETFERTLTNSGVKLRDVPNTDFNRQEMQFSFAEYVPKDPDQWAYVSNDPDAVDVEAVAEAMYDAFDTAFEDVPEITLDRQEDEMYWAHVTVDIPADETRQQELGRIVGEAILQQNEAR